MASDPGKLIEKARIFDQEALGEIYDLYSDALYAYAFKHVGSNQAAEDLVAETFKRFLLALQRGGGPKEHLQAYLYRITHNLITDIYRREPPPSLEIKEVVDQLRGIRCPSPAWENGVRVFSCADAIARVMEKRLVGMPSEITEPKVATSANESSAASSVSNNDFLGVHMVVGVCPDCGSALRHEEGCVKCQSCGYTKC